MSLRFAYVLLFSVCAFGLVIAVPAFPGNDICGPNAEYNSCGSACAPDCAKPIPPDACIMQCIVGCFCKEGYLKNAKGECVLARDCPAPQCPNTEVFLTCGTACPATCANPHPSPVCTKNCVIGCFCKPGYLKNENGVCVQPKSCSGSAAAANVMPIQPQMCREDKEEFRQCKGCDGTCKNPTPICPHICISGCACKQGYVRSESGKCIDSRECSVQVKSKSSMMFPPVPTCSSNEVFFTCGTACPATCANPHPSPVCTKNCVIGCFCKEGYLKNAQGICVAAINC